ncbi:MAG: hypothetical protein ACLPP9_06540 [Smithella sp.]
MTRQELLKEKERIPYMILGIIQRKHDFNQLTSLLARQAWLSSEIKEEGKELTCPRYLYHMLS